MPLPEDTAPGRALELVEELGRVVVASPAGVRYVVRADGRHVVRHALVGGVLAFWVGRLLSAAFPVPVALLVAPLCLVLGAGGWALRFPPRAAAWVQADRVSPEDEVGGTVAWVGVRARDRLPDTVDALVERVREGSLDGLPEHTGLDRVRLRWRLAPPA
jgi:hypothetical protein